MKRRPLPDSAIDLRRIRKEQGKKRRARLRIMIASDPNRPIRTISLPRVLPVVISLTAGTLVLATVFFAFGSWRLSDARSTLERRVRAMVQAADSVALRQDREQMDATTMVSVLPQIPLMPPARVVSGAVGRFVVQSVNNGEEMVVNVNLGTGEVPADDYRRLRHLMRCLHTGAETPVDPRLIDLLLRIAQRTKQKIGLVSGFRAPMYSVATLSYHTRGMAADIRIAGMTPLMVRDLAESMGVHGLGYYPVSGFVHVDVRDDRARWIDYGTNRQNGEGSEHGPARGEAMGPLPEAGDVAHGDLKEQVSVPAPVTDNHQDDQQPRPRSDQAAL
jgi:uncharacterized protein YcbK (DUF882 family)